MYNDPISHHAFRHSVASIVSSFRPLRAGVISFFALLNTRSHSVDIAGIECIEGHLVEGGEVLLIVNVPPK
jgi:hypothetical protein